MRGLIVSELLEIAIIQMDVQIGKPVHNWEKIKDLLSRLVKDVDTGIRRKPDIIILPEMWNTGYALDQAVELGDRNSEQTKTFFSAFAKQHQIHMICGSVASVEEDGIYNRSWVFNRSGDEVASYAKIHLFRLMDEEKFLQPGSKPVLFELDGIRCGLMICYDLRFPELTRTYSLHGAEIVFIPAQWPHPRLTHWRILQQARAIENQMYVITCNRVGVSGDTSFCGHSAVVDPWGEVLREADETEQIVSVTIDRSIVAQVRHKIPIFKDRRPECYQLD
jgi:omega-amidase